jgi:membrane protein YdbS with pleckstrin-like domain
MASMTPQDELTARELSEARARAQGRVLRRFLVLLAVGVLLVWVGAEGRETLLACTAGAVMIVVAVIVLVRGDRT